MSKGALAGMSVIQGDTIPESMIEGFKIYRGLTAKAPNMAWKHADDNARQFFDVARVLVDTGATDERKALVTAVEYQRDPARFNDVTARQKATQIDDQLQRMSGNALARLVGWAELPTFSRAGDIATDIQKLARIYASVGRLTADEAIRQAGWTVRKNYTEINGMAVRTSDRNVPPNFKENTETFLKRFSEQSLTSDYGPGDLSIRPIGNTGNAWMVISKQTLLPVADGSRGVMTLQDLKEIDDLKVAKARLQAEMTSRKRSEQATEKAKEAGKSVERLKAGGVNAPVSPMIEAPALKKPGDIPPPNTM